MRGVAAADSRYSTISVRGSPAERGTRLTRLHQRPWLPRARFCRCSVQLICIESHGPGPPCMTNPATPRLIRVNATLTYPLGRIRMCRARLKPQGQRFDPVRLPTSLAQLSGLGAEIPALDGPELGTALRHRPVRLQRGGPPLPRSSGKVAGSPQSGPTLEAVRWWLVEGALV
jgi:hypothetical protein